MWRPVWVPEEQKAFRDAEQVKETDPESGFVFITILRTYNLFAHCRRGLYLYFGRAPLLRLLLLDGDARSRNFSCLAPFFNLPPHAERDTKPYEYGN